MSTQFARPIFNYPLPDDFYSQSTYRSHARGTPFHPDSVPRSMCIDPQHLMVASPLSPPPEDYPFPIAPYPAPLAPRMEERSPTDYTGHGSRKRSAPTILYQDQDPHASYTLERASGHRPSRSSSQQSMSYHHSSNNSMRHGYSTLPSPPLSPSSTIPAPTMPSSISMRMSMSMSPRSPISSSSNGSISDTDSHSHHDAHGSPTLSTISSISNNNHSNNNNDASSSTPIIPLLPPTSKCQTTQRFYCMHASCVDPIKISKASFSRRADLARHNTSMHEAKVLFSCPRPNCARKGENGFTRQDHLKEHRRGYHGEAIPKRGSRGGGGGGGANAARIQDLEHILELDGEVVALQQEKRRRKTR